MPVSFEWRTSNQLPIQLQNTAKMLLLFYRPLTKSNENLSSQAFTFGIQLNWSVSLNYGVGVK